MRVDFRSILCHGNAYGPWAALSARPALAAHYATLEFGWHGVCLAGPSVVTKCMKYANVLGPSLQVLPIDEAGVQITTTKT